MKFLVAIVLSNLIQLGYSQGTPRIVSITEDRIKSIGASVDLACSVQNSENYQVTWSKLNSVVSGASDLLISNNSNLLFGNDRKYVVAVFSDLLTTKYVLRIKDLKEEDVGLYECQISISDKRKVSAQVELQICKTPIVVSDVDYSLPPKIADMPEKELKYLNNTVEFVCSVKNNVNLYPVLWIKGNSSNDSELPIIISANSHLVLANSRFSVLFDSADPNNYTLQIRNIQKNDAGVYYCLVPISATNKTFKQVELQIDENEMPRIIRLSSNFSKKSTFNCKVENRKDYPIMWIKYFDDRNPVIISYRTMVTEGNDKYAVTYDTKSSIYTLEVKNVQFSDGGVYECRIDTGTIIVSAKLDVVMTTPLRPDVKPSNNYEDVNDENTNSDSDDYYDD